MNEHEWASPHLPTDASSGNKENTTHTMYISWNTAFVKTVSNALSAIRKQEFQYMLFQGRSLERRRKQSSSPKGRWADRNHWGGCRQPPSPQLGRQGDSQGKGQVFPFVLNGETLVGGIPRVLCRIILLHHYLLLIAVIQTLDTQLCLVLFCHALITDNHSFSFIWSAWPCQRPMGRTANIFEKLLCARHFHVSYLNPTPVGS